MTEQMTVLEMALRRRIDGAGKAFVPYVMGGLYGVDAELLQSIEATGADVIEIGVPFSDPVMDGGVIQEASRRAIEAKFHPRDAFALVKEAGLSIPVVLMTYYNPVLAMGEKEWIAASVEAGVAGFIVPDLPVDEADDFRTICATANLAPVFLAAPGTATERMKAIADASRGFIYCVSTYGVTGTRKNLEESTARSVVEALRPFTDRPLLVGVGVSTPQQGAESSTFADGCIVGSALVKPMLEGDFQGAITLAKEFRAAIPN